MGLRFSSQGLRFRSQGLRFRSVIFVLDHRVLGLRSSFLGLRFRNTLKAELLGYLFLLPVGLMKIKLRFRIVCVLMFPVAAFIINHFLCFII